MLLFVIGKGDTGRNRGSKGRVMSVRGCGPTDMVNVFEPPYRRENATNGTLQSLPRPGRSLHPRLALAYVKSGEAHKPKLSSADSSQWEGVGEVGGTLDPLVRANELCASDRYRPLE